MRKGDTRRRVRVPCTPCPSRAGGADQPTRPGRRARPQTRGAARPRPAHDAQAARRGRRGVRGEGLPRGPRRRHREARRARRTAPSTSTSPTRKTCSARSRPRSPTRCRRSPRIARAARRRARRARAALREWIGRFADLYEHYGPVIRAWTEAEIGEQRVRPARQRRARPVHAGADRAHRRGRAARPRPDDRGARARRDVRAAQLLRAVAAGARRARRRWSTRSPA